MNRNERVINAFINCVKSGVYSIDYATTLIEDNQKYGYLTDADKSVFYTAMAEIEAQAVEVEVVVNEG